MIKLHLNPRVSTRFHAADDGGDNGTGGGKPAKKKKDTITVRVVGTQPISEDGKVYWPAADGKTEGVKKRDADVFEVTPERLEALGDLVEAVK